MEINLNLLDIWLYNDCPLVGVVQNYQTGQYSLFLDLGKYYMLMPFLDNGEIESLRTRFLDSNIATLITSIDQNRIVEIYAFRGYELVQTTTLKRVKEKYF